TIPILKLIALSIKQNQHLAKGLTINIRRGIILHVVHFALEVKMHWKEFGIRQSAKKIGPRARRRLRMKGRFNRKSWRPDNHRTRAALAGGLLNLPAGML